MANAKAVLAFLCNEVYISPKAIISHFLTIGHNCPVPVDKHDSGLSGRLAILLNVQHLRVLEQEKPLFSISKSYEQMKFNA